MYCQDVDVFWSFPLYHVQMVKRYRPIKWSTERNGEEMDVIDILPSAVAAIMDEDLEFETPPEFIGSEVDLDPMLPSIPGEEEEFFSLYPISLQQQQQHGLPPLSLESQDSDGPYYSLMPLQSVTDQSNRSFLQSHYGPRLDRLSSQDQQPKSLGGTFQRFQSHSLQPASLSINRMQSSNISGVRRVLQNMARAITKELHLD